MIYIHILISQPSHAMQQGDCLFDTHLPSLTCTAPVSRTLHTEPLHQPALQLSHVCCMHTCPPTTPTPTYKASNGDPDQGPDPHRLGVHAHHLLNGNASCSTVQQVGNVLVHNHPVHAVLLDLTAQQSTTASSCLRSVGYLWTLDSPSQSSRVAAQIMHPMPTPSQE